MLILIIFFIILFLNVKNIESFSPNSWEKKTEKYITNIGIDLRAINQRHTNLATTVANNARGGVVFDRTVNSRLKKIETDLKAAVVGTDTSLKVKQESLEQQITELKNNFNVVDDKVDTWEEWKNDTTLRLDNLAIDSHSEFIKKSDLTTVQLGGGVKCKGGNENWGFEYCPDRIQTLFPIANNQ